MRRLPASRQLDALIQAGGPSEAEAEAVARRLCRFHLGLTPQRPDPAVFVRNLQHELELSLALLGAPRFGLPQAPLREAARRLIGFIEDERHHFAARIEAGRVVEGHGDLRPEHVFVLESPVIIDCLEFSRRLRVVDVIDELGFLALECERLGAAWVGERLLAQWSSVSADRPAPGLLAFYQGLRACIRARLAIAHLDDVHVKHPHPWRARAQQYLDLLGRRLQLLAPGGSAPASERS
jgi:aminoglycoside phosphotransferase family enzyme